MTQPRDPKTKRFSKPKPDGIVSPPTPRGTQTLAALGIVIVAVTAVGALAWNTIFFSEDTAALTSIASIAVGGLIALAGGAAGAALAKKDEPKE